MIPPAIGAGVSYWWFETAGKDTLSSSIFPITMWFTIFGMVLYIVFLYFFRKKDMASEGRVPVISQFKIIFLPIVVL